MPISLKYFMECEYKNLWLSMSFNEWIESLELKEQCEYIKDYISSSWINFSIFVKNN